MLSFSLGCGIFFKGMIWVYSFSESIDPEFKYSVVIINSIILLLLALFSTTFPAVTSYYFSKYLKRKAPYLIAVLVFTIFEWIRSTLFTGLPYYQPGYVLIDSPFAALAPVGGVLLITFVFFCLIACVLIFLSSKGKQRLVPVFALMGIVLVTGVLNFQDWSKDAGSYLVRIVHGSSSNADKEDYLKMHQRLDRYIEYTLASPTPKLIIWPEGSVNSGQGMYRKIRSKTKALSRAGVTVLFGGYPENYQEKYNALLSAEKLKVEYRKYHLIPFGEYTPDIPIPFLNIGQHLPEIDNSSLTKGPVYQPVSLSGDLTFRTAICFELIFGDEIRITQSDYGLFIHISDLGWFNGTPVAFHMLQMARMRALELSKPVLRATNFGISSAIDHKGNVVKKITDQAEQYFDVEITTQKGLTPYVRFGSTPLVWLMGIYLILLFLSKLCQLNKKSNSYSRELEQNYE